MFKVPLRNVYPKSILWISKIVLLNLQSNIFQNQKHNDENIARSTQNLFYVMIYFDFVSSI